MSEVAPEVSQPSAVPADPLTRRQRTIVLTLAIVFAAMPFFFIGDLKIHDYELHDLQATGFFFSLGLLPGTIGIVYHIVTGTSRRTKGREIIQQYYAVRNNRPQARAQEKVTARIGAHIS